MHFSRALLTSLLLAPLFAGSALAQTKPAAKKAAPAAMPAPVTLGSEKWGEIPAAAIVGTPSVEMGGKLQIAIIQGNPLQAGQPYTVRLACDNGVKIAPHWHPTAENVTVLKGTFAFAMGSKWDPATLKELSTGAFVTAPARMRHFASCKGDTVLQVHGVGPLVINFVPAA